MRRRAFPLAAGAICALSAGFTGCEDQVTSGAPHPNGGGTDTEHAATRVDKIDILLSVDGSRSMADKHAVLAPAVNELVSALVERAPGLSIHIGVVSSSLGSYGAGTCPVEPESANDDGGHLLARDAAGGTVPTYQDYGFVAWDPAGELSPPGESDRSALEDAVTRLVLGVGQRGCGYEAQLESWYRFLADPEPYAGLATDPSGTTVPTGVDDALLEERQRFLRPDSLLAIVMLTDENDCSLDPTGQNPLVLEATTPAGTTFRMPRARGECADDPSDECCASCLGAVPAGCPEDAACTAQPFLTPLEDPINLRCFEQKRRFGFDALHDVSRYVDALREPTIANRAGVLVDNPIFAGGQRDPGLVVLAGIVGVPWQDLARDPLDATSGNKSAAELLADGTWTLVLGEGDAGVPADPLMRESVDVRSGTHPLLGVPIATAATPGANPINGHDFEPPDQGDLQFACITPLAAPRDCTTGEACDCTDPDNQSPLCAPNPGDPAGPERRTLQVAYKAYPGRRQLQVLRDLGDQAVVASICAPQLDEPNEPDFGYRSTVTSLVGQVGDRLLE